MKTKMWIVIFTIPLLVALLSPAPTVKGNRPPALVAPPNGTALQPTATLSGVIRHGGNPVAGVTVWVSWDSGEDTSVTGSDGLYSVGMVPLGSSVHITVRPPLEMHLEYRNWFTSTLSSDAEKNFDLQVGYRLEGSYRQPDGALYTGESPQISPLGVILPAGEYLDMAVNDGHFDTVLAPAFYAVYFVGKDDNAWLRQPYAMPPTIFDLRNNDTVSQTITLLDRPVSFPSEPPIASLIAVSEPDEAGYATVSGKAGALPPLVGVMVVNLNANNVAVTASDATGAFTTPLYAPPGSSLLVKYDPGGQRVADLWAWAQISDKETALAVQNLPGTIVYVGQNPAGGNTWQDFEAVGHYTWWTGWWVSGTLQTSRAGLSVLPGETFTVTARVVATSPALECTGTPTYTMGGNGVLNHLFGVNGRPLPQGTWFTSFLFTPTGLPIEHEATSQTWDLGPASFVGATCVGEHALATYLQQSFAIPVTVTEGTYSPQLLILPFIPADDSVPSVAVWFHNAEVASLPPIRVGEPAPPRIPWTLFGDVPVNGYRGLTARQDAASYALPTRVRHAGQPMVIPMLDERTGNPIRYQLEPGSYWLSGTERRTPNPPKVLLDLPSGELVIEIQKPDGAWETIGPAPILQASVRTPSLLDGSDLDEGTGYIGDIFHLATLDERFAYSFDQYGRHAIYVHGHVNDIYGNSYLIESTYDVTVARVLDLDSAQLPTTPYQVGDAFAPGLHIFPPVPAEVHVQLIHLPYSDPAQTITFTVSGHANPFGYFQPPQGTQFHFEQRGEFRVDITAEYLAPDGTFWSGATTWGNVVASPAARFDLHGRRGMDYKSDTINYDNPAWFTNATLPPEVVGLENYYPYHSGDILWGSEVEQLGGGDSLHTILTLRDLTMANEEIYNILRDYYPKARNAFRRPPLDISMVGLEQRLDIGEAPLFITTRSGIDPGVDPYDIDFMGYWYGSSERPDVHVREIISEDGLGTAYWRYHDTYGYQIGEPANGDQPGDIKWNFGGAVFRVISETNPINEYGIYGSFWVLLPHDDPVGARVTSPFQFAAGGLNGGPILSIGGEEIDMLFLPRGVRPGDVLEVGDAVSFSGHVGPPLDSRVAVTITSPLGAQHVGTWHANKIGWLYDPTFDFVADEPGRWTVDVSVCHDRPYLPTGLTPASHNTGTVLGTAGRYEFYVVEPDSPRLFLTSPQPGFITWPNEEIEPIHIRGIAPAGTTAVHYTVHDKGVVMGQATTIPDASGAFTLTYDAEALHQTFSMLSLTAREGRWEGLADEVEINLLAVGSQARGNTVTLIGEEVFIGNAIHRVYLPLTLKEP